MDISVHHNLLKDELGNCFTPLHIEDQFISEENIFLLVDSFHIFKTSYNNFVNKKHLFFHF
uniref:Uncharacterized protein n=1 Tax=Lepeophtheirus salmonis TaxID=72036 RepID=A0A0K2UPH5_LEPSM